VAYVIAEQRIDVKDTAAPGSLKVAPDETGPQDERSFALSLIKHPSEPVPDVGTGDCACVASILASQGTRVIALDKDRGTIRAAQNIRYHYDRSNKFYKQFLDKRMVYSCAYFRTPETPLDDAQVAKLDHICRKLDLRRGDRFLDMGSGWGALLVHAAEHYGVQATGCTLSRSQAEYARDSASHRVTGEQVAVLEMDFRDVTGHFNKIASVGMLEHVGRHRLHNYFRKVHDLLGPKGIFLNHSILRPELVTDSAQTLFIQRRVFPGGELAHLSVVIRAAELAGFEVLDAEDLRPHYALTCRAWVERLQRNAGACLDAVDRETYRTWLLYLAGSAASFEGGLTSVCQLLLAKRNSPARRLTREYMCSGISC
jgi:cyclopropane-fatty-acyl-phospholipid synthase